MLTAQLFEHVQQYSGNGDVTSVGFRLRLFKVCLVGINIAGFRNMDDIGFVIDIVPFKREDFVTTQPAVQHNNSSNAKSVFLPTAGDQPNLIVIKKTSFRSLHAYNLCLQETVSVQPIIIAGKVHNSRCALFDLSHGTGSVALFSHVIQDILEVDQMKLVDLQLT